MKLIDLLVKELPKLGGWPEGAEYARVTGFGGEKILVDFLFPKTYNKLSYSIGIIACHLIDAGAGVDFHMIRRDSYESALAASQKPAWNGEGLPPAGCECELKYKCHNDDAYWERVVILWQRGDDTLVEYVGDHFKNTTQLIHKTSMHVDLRPLRTESERKHEAVLESICAVLTMVAQDYKREDEAKLIYEAIAAGKIPGVKLDD